MVSYPPKCSVGLLLLHSRGPYGLAIYLQSRTVFNLILDWVYCSVAILRCAISLNLFIDHYCWRFYRALWVQLASYQTLASPSIARTLYSVFSFTAPVDTAIRFTDLHVWSEHCWHNKMGYLSLQSGCGSRVAHTVKV